MTAISKQPFPLLPPASTSDAAVIREHDWAAFQQLDTVHDHWSVKAWEPGQAGYYWYLTFAEPAVIDLAARCQEKLAQHGFDPVPLDGLHLTLLSLGRTDEVGGEQLNRIADAGRRAAKAIRPFRLSVGPATGSRSALRLSVTPWEQLLDLHGRLRTATADHCAPGRLAETSTVRPHLGIGYLNQEQDARQLVSDVGALRGLLPATVRVQRIQLVEVWRAGRAYRWHEHASIPLG
ncbi:2'-5' RNA ligase family protein [Nocardia sp. NPDC048505]|uniref:2'-5' RNA ligase family protein n=1 Tax=unclassified Nocardia TaxID=2637762 RepID=UPI00340415AA